MDQSEVSNLYADLAVMTWWCCVRCIAWFGGGQYRCGGKVGCTFPPLTDEIRHHFVAWLMTLDLDDDIQTMRCFRCFLTNSDCFALPKIYRSHNVDIKDCLNQLEDDSCSQIEKSAAQSKLANICRVLTKKIQSEQSPYAQNLVLHNGAIARTDNPESDVKIAGRRRDKATLQAKAESHKRKIEEQVAAEMSSPHKKGKTVVGKEKKECLAKAAQLASEIDDLEGAYEGATKAQKAKIRKNINSKGKARADLLSKANSLA